MKHCMIVDDSDIIRKVARIFLERLGYMVIEAQNGDEALTRCDLGMPDLILMDWHMPGRTTFDTIEILRRMHASRRPTIVYMTTENDESDIALAKKVGIDDCLLKPFDRISFEAKINELALHA